MREGIPTLTNKIDPASSWTTFLHKLQRNSLIQLPIMITIRINASKTPPAELVANPGADSVSC